MTVMTQPSASLPQWLHEAVLGLVMAAYEAGRADGFTPTPTCEPDILNRREAARALGCGLTRLAELIRDGELPTFKIGRQRLIRRADIDAHLARFCSPRVTSVPPAPRSNSSPHPGA